jgi:hypothetical protein
MPSSRELIIAADRWADSREQVSLKTLQAMCKSPDTLTRVKALRFMWRHSSPRFPSAYFDLAEGLIPDRRNTCRWQALIVIGGFITHDPEEVWRIICEYGSSTDDDMRTAVAVLLLEELLDWSFRKHFPRVKARVVSGDRLFANTLSRCRIDRQHRPKLESLLSAFASPR